MRNCYKCLENDWSFEKIEDIIRATCNQCGYEVEFEAKKKKKQKKQEINVRSVVVYYFIRSVQIDHLRKIKHIFILVYINVESVGQHI